MENETTIDTTPTAPVSTPEVKPEIKIEPQAPIEPVKYELPKEILDKLERYDKLESEVSSLRGIVEAVPEMKGKLETLENEKRENEYKKMVSSVPGINPATVDDFAKLHPGLNAQQIEEVLQQKPHFMKVNVPGVAVGGSSVERKMETGNKSSLDIEKRNIIQKLIFGV